VGEDIGSSTQLEWELGSPHTAAVCRASASQMRSVLPQAVMIGTISFPALGLTRSFWDFVDPRNLCGSSRPGYPVISSHPLPMLLEPEPLFLTNSLRMPWLVRCESWHIFAAYVHIVLVSHEDTTTLDIVKSCYCAGIRPPSSVTISTLTMSVPILISLVCILHCSMPWRSGDG